MDTQLYRISTNDSAGILSAELCFYIIDAVYMTPLAKLLPAVAQSPRELWICMPTMASTVRIWIFNAVRLNDPDTLHKVSMLLKAVPAVASYVEKLYVFGHSARSKKPSRPGYASPEPTVGCGHPLFQCVESSRNVSPPVDSSSFPSPVTVA